MNRPTRGVIAAGHPQTAEAGQIIFDLGGNAFDAAAAAALASFVVESTLTTAAGGGFLLAHTQQKQNYLFDFFSQTPLLKKAQSELDFYPVEINFGDEIQTFHIGLGACATPGNLAGIFLIQQKLGTLPFEVVAEPAIVLARNGFTLDPYIARTWELLQPILLASVESRQIYAPQKTLLTCGQRCYMKDFAETLSEIARKGIEIFYEGEIAHQIANDLKIGGYLSLKDLAHYPVRVRQPLMVNYRGYQLLTNPPPSSGGALIAFALKLLERFDLGNMTFYGVQHLQLLAQVLSQTSQARKKHFDACVHQPDAIAQFLSASTLNQYQSEIQNTVNKWGSTTHISVLDEYGNAASITTSNGEGSGYVIPNTGIMLNNMLGEADLNPLGFHQWPCNQRISSMMSPTMILKDNQPEIVLGSGGSNRIRSAIFQVISNLLDFDFPLEAAVSNPRVHWDNHIFSLEPNRPMVDVAQLKLPEFTQPLLWERLNLFFGGVHAVRKTENLNFEGVGDPRRAGVAIVC